MGMTLNDFEAKALQVLLSQRFLSLRLFEEEELSNYEVADIQGSMPFDDFIRQYAEVITEQFKADYENRLKADMVAMLTEIQLECEENTVRWYVGRVDGKSDDVVLMETLNEIIQQKINSLKGEQE